MPPRGVYSTAIADGIFESTILWNFSCTVCPLTYGYWVCGDSGVGEKERNERARPGGYGNFWIGALTGNSASLIGRMPSFTARRL